MSLPGAVVLAAACRLGGAEGIFERGGVSGHERCQVLGVRAEPAAQEHPRCFTPDVHRQDDCPVGKHGNPDVGVAGGAEYAGMLLQIAIPEPAPQLRELGFSGGGLEAERPLPVVGLLHDVKDRGERAVSDADYPQTDGKEGLNPIKVPNVV